MSLQLTLSMSAQMKQELKLAPQLQLAIKHLQLSRADLIEEIQHELMSNPLLEENKISSESDTTLERDTSSELSSDRAERGDDHGAAPGEPGAELNRGDQRRELNEGGSSDEGAPSERAELSDFDSAQLAAEARQEIDWDRELDDRRAYRELDSPRLTEDDNYTPEAHYSRDSNLQDHLLEQAHLSELTPLEQSIAEELIWNLDERGYLVGLDIEDIASQLDVELDTVEYVLETVQRFDPVGVGARNLKECLLIQAESSDTSPKLIELIEHHLSDVERNQLPFIAKKLKVSIEQVSELLRELRRFEPYPGRRFSSGEIAYVTPDVYVEWVEGELQVRSNHDGLPQLRVNRHYRDQLRAHLKAHAETRARRSLKKRGGSSDELRYLSERASAAQAFINSLQQRKKTIVSVMECIIRFQRDFFSHGPEHLKPLVLRQIAEELNLHESTISRATSNKFVHTPRGLFELKYFFHSKIQSCDGSEDLASQAVKVKIKNLIDTEDPRKPLSDQKLVELLADSGVSIARRTVAKYREALNIPSSSKRRQYV